jgi:hypothetical protein
MTAKTIVLISRTPGGASGNGFASRLADALHAAGCRVERAAAADAERILDLLESGAVPVFTGAVDE